MSISSVISVFYSWNSYLCEAMLLTGQVQNVMFMPPTSKKLRGHIGLGLSVQSSPVCDA